MTKKNQEQNKKKLEETGRNFEKKKYKKRAKKERNGKKGIN